MESTFAERLYWARMRKNVGATVLAKETGCSQSLLSFIERNNGNDPGKYGKLFATALEVDPSFLIDGNLAAAPPGFDVKLARKARETHDKTIVRNATKAAAAKAALVKKSPFDALKATDANPLQHAILEAVIAYRKLTSTAKLKALLKMLDALD